MDLDISLDRSSGALLSHQIGRVLIDLIGGGALQAGARLPSTRELSRQLGVSRMTVVEAYGWLSDLGYVESRHGSSTTVRALRLSKGANVRGLSRNHADGEDARKRAPIDLYPGLPDLSLFPRQQWLSALGRCLRAMPTGDFGYGSSLGHHRLREAIAAYLYRSRGFDVEPRNVVITVGAAQAIDLMIRMLPDLREIIIESPGSPAQRRLSSAYDVTIREVPVDDKGLRTDLLPEGDGVRRLAFVMPSHQFPTGHVMSIERRLELIEWADRNDSLILEDDYDSEFAFDGRPAMPLAKLDPSGRVIYIGTFSKTLIPALRIGFMIAPDALLAKVSELKWWADRGGGALQQDALALWMEEGVFERHLQRMRKVYRDRCRDLTSCLKQNLGDRIRFIGERVGMHVVALVTHVDADAVVAKCLEKGVGIYAVPGLFPGARENETAFALGFGNVDPNRLVAGCEIFAEIVSAMLPKPQKQRNIGLV